VYFWHLKLVRFLFNPKKILTGLKTVRIACNTGKKDKEQHSFETGRQTTPEIPFQISRVMDAVT
jgi:hypothetical protein